MPGVPGKTPYDETGHHRSAAQISRGAQGRRAKQIGATNGPPRGTSSASKTARSKNTKILASLVTMDSNKNLDSKSKDKDESLLEELESESHDGTQLWFGMEALQQSVYTKGSVLSIFANIVSKAWTSGQDF